MAHDVNLRWLDVVPREREAPDRHDVLNALTAICTAATLLDERWDELTDEQRRDVAATLRRRSLQLRGLFAG